MENKSVLVIGSGGREHAIAWKLTHSPKVTRVVVAPGNAGTEQLEKTENTNLAVTDIEGIIAFSQKEQIDLIVVGPEASLAAGITDAAQKAGIPCLGPTKAVAMLEISKAFSKAFMIKHNIPTAKYAEFDQLEPALAYAKEQAFPLVIKADGLAAGKGVVIAQNQTEAIEALSDMLENDRYGSAGRRVIIEEFLEGEELSFIALSDGEHIIPLDTSRDHKHRFEGDSGPNTGGMGAYSPVLIADSLQKSIIKDIMIPVVRAMKESGTPYVGFLYAGLMLDKNMQPRVLEFNCRLGDPETQPLLMRLQSDLLDLIEATLAGELEHTTAKWDPRPAITVVLAAEGYPGDYLKGDVIPNLTEAIPENCFIFHAGTKCVDNQVQTNGGRVLGVTAIGSDLLEAQQNAYDLCRRVAWKGCGFRSDIGWRGLI